MKRLLDWIAESDLIERAIIVAFFVGFPAYGCADMCGVFR